MARDKEETKARILATVGKLLAESGFQQLGAWVSPLQRAC